MIKINLSKPILLVDTSYVIFYRYFATINWMKMAEKISKKNEDNDYDKILENTDFIKTYKKMFWKCIFDIAKKYKINNDNIILCYDCAQKNIWRNDLFSDYKGNREDMKSPHFNGKIFPHTYENIIPELIKNYKIQIMKIDNAEADDVVAIIHKSIRQKNDKANINIITNDNDYLQLGDDNTVIINLAKKLIKTRGSGDYKKDLFTKIIKGDISDNIPPVFPKCGVKTINKIYENNNELEKMFIKYQESKKKYELNRTLIDFHYIPNNIQQKIFQNLEFI